MNTLPLARSFNWGQNQFNKAVRSAPEGQSPILTYLNAGVQSFNKNPLVGTSFWGLRRLNEEMGLIVNSFTAERGPTLMDQLAPPTLLNGATASNLDFLTAPIDRFNVLADPNFGKNLSIPVTFLPNNIDGAVLPTLGTTTPEALNFLGLANTFPVYQSASLANYPPFVNAENTAQRYALPTQAGVYFAHPTNFEANRPQPLQFDNRLWPNNEANVATYGFVNEATVSEHTTNSPTNSSPLSTFDPRTGVSNNNLLSYGPTPANEPWLQVLNTPWFNTIQF
jgi:hypothetical protein